MTTCIQDAKWKLTAVTASGNGRRIQTFIMLPYIDGKALLTGDYHTTIQEKLRLRHGDGYSVA